MDRSQEYATGLQVTQSDRMARMPHTMAKPRTTVTTILTRVRTDEIENGVGKIT